MKLSRRGFSCGLPHGPFHTVLACPIQADFVTFGIIEISVPPAPGHHAGELSDVKAFLLELTTEIVEIADFEV